MNHCTMLAAVALLGTGATAEVQFATVPVGATAEEIARLSAHVVPSARQLRWQEVDVSAFVHFGMNTFTNREWGEGNEDPALFNPTDLDARQWVEACKSAGIGTLILTAKHHDGFCLWPSAFTEHSVKNSPWRGGKGDVVREVADACREGGIRFGVYLSPWDRHEPTYGDSPVYNEYFQNQLRELLTDYGPVAEVWFDGACGEGPNGKRQEYDFPSYFRLIRELQPEAVTSICGIDVRWCGNEAGVSRETEWSVVPVDGSPETTIGCDAMAADLGSRGKLPGATLLAWYPSQVNTSIRPGWFYHPSEDGQVKSLEHLLDVYYGAVGGNSQFLLNIPPDQRGRFHESDVARLGELGAVLRATFGNDIARGAAATADTSADGHAPEAVVDETPRSYWTTPEGTTAGTLELDLGGVRTFDRVSLEEAIWEGQRVEAFGVDAWDAGRSEWAEIGHGTTIGHRRILRMPAVNTSRVRVRIAEARDCPTLARVGLFLAPELAKAPAIARDRGGMVTIEGARGAEIRYWVAAEGWDTSDRKYEGPFALPRGGTVRALLIPPDDGRLVTQAGASLLATREFGLAKAGWRVVSADSQDEQEGAAANAIDDAPATYWHTEWRTAEPAHPHEIVIDLGEETDLAGLTYLPRQDGNPNGMPVHYQVLVSLDGTAWGEPVAAGEFGNIRNNPVEQRVSFAQPVRGRYVRFVALDEVQGKPWTSAAEIGLLPPAPAGPPKPVVADPAAWTQPPAGTAIAPVKRGNREFPLSDQANADGWVAYEPMWDEFDSRELDATKWWPRNPTWLGRQPGWFSESNVRVSDGSLQLSMRKEEPPEEGKAQGYHTYTSAAVQSKTTVRYGYFEVRAKAMASAGSSAFWFYHGTPEWWTEIDVFEIGGKSAEHARRLYMTCHFFRSPAVDEHWSVGDFWTTPEDLADDWHVYGLEWDESELRFYLDGVLVRQGPNTAWRQPLTMNFDSETMPEWFGLPRDEDLPSTYEIDYVRAWKKG